MQSTRPLQTILLVDDSPSDRLLASREIKRAFPDVTIQEAINWDEFEAALARDGFDLVITDYDLQWATGIDILRKVRERHPYQPVIMFTDSGSQEIAVEAMKAGLDDYVLKSSKHLMRLSQAVRSVWENSRIRRRAWELDLRLQFLLNELNVGVFRATAAGQLLEASDGLLNLFNAADLDEAQAFFQQYIGLSIAQSNDQQGHREIEIQMPRQASRWLMVSETRIGEETDLIDGLVNDITQRKQTAAALKTLNQTLEQRVIQRTSRLESLNKELEMFAFSVSHDLRSPIRQIDGFAAFLEDQLRSQVSPPEATVATVEADATDASERSPIYFVGQIRKLTARAGKMIDDLLQFSRTGRAEMTYTNVSMERLVQEAIRQLEPHFRHRTVQWQIEPLPTVRGDRTLLRKVWQNLIDNAVKYTQSEATAIITIGSEDRPTETVFFVRDNGVGFNMEDAEQLFGVFQRLHSARDYEGTGLGLANVQRVMHRHQGQLWGEGEVGMGATFYFSIPKPEDDA